MAHPYKSYSEQEHGRKVAKSRVKGYQSGGKVLNFPISGLEESRNRLASTQGIQSGRIPKVSADNAVAGPGRFPGTGGIKPSVLRRMNTEDMPMKRGGAVPAYRSGGKIPEMTGGAASGIGRLQMAAKAARKRK